MSKEINNFAVYDKVCWPSISFGFYEVYEKETRALYSARIKFKEDDPIFESFESLKHFNHPSICKYITQGLIDYDNKHDAIILEYIRCPLSEMIYQKNTVLDSTRKLIIIYGLALGLSYLHSNNILHCNLNPYNVCVNHYLLPKITGIYDFKRINSNVFKEQLFVKGVPAYLAPEIYLGKGNSKASDVYSFALIVYELMTNEKAYHEMSDVIQIRHLVAMNGCRPKFNTKIPDFYRSLIERCWSQDPEERPTFEQILNEIETNPLFLTDVNEDEFRDYLNYASDFEFSFDNLHFRIHKSYEYDDFSDYYKLNEIYKYANLPYFVYFIDNNLFEKQKTSISKSRNFKVCSVVEKLTQKRFAAKIHTEKWEKGKESFIHELNMVINVNHPCITKFIGLSFNIVNQQKFKPELIFELYSKGTLANLLEMQRKNKEIEYLNETKKLIIIYGIAYGMKYLHSYNILHRDLKTEKIYLDDYLLPKIGGFGFSKFKNSAIKSNTFNGSTVKYMAPEFLKNPESNNRYKFIDVYSFSIILYEIVTSEDPYPDDNPVTIKNDVLDGKRPNISESIPAYYKSLIERCWSQDIKNRPSFDEIVEELETNRDYITENVNEEEYQKFIKYVKDPTTFPYSSDDIVTIEQMQKNLFVNVKSADLNQFERQDRIGKGSFGKVYKVLNKETGDVQACKISILPIDSCNDELLRSMERELDIISQLNFPSILKFIGFSQNNFKNQRRPTFITELVTNGSLDIILSLERRSLSGDNWNDTKKLINIYGIAAGMAYLHSLDIIHRDLKPENIFIDDFLFPKIGDFGLSKKITEQVIKEEEKMKLNSGQKGTVPFMSPEIIIDCKYTKAGDVYAFALIVYQIVTNEILFKGWIKEQIMLNVIKGYRPAISSDVPKCYRKLIENCWKENPEDRPTFDEIVEILKTDSDFITSAVDEDEFNEYVDFIDDMMAHKDEETVKDTKEIMEKSFQKVSIDLSRADDDDGDDASSKDDFLDLSLFEKLETISQTDTYKLLKIKNNHNGLVYSAKVTTTKLNKLSRRALINISREINNISQIKHPAILKFIGYSPVDFMNKHRPVIVTEFTSKGTLSEVLSKERLEKDVEEWDLTKKLINLYGIAEGMSFLHSNNILHRDLTPESIFLNDSLHPKIGNFGLSLHSHTLQSLTFQSTVGIKGSPVYSAPEVLQMNDYSEKSDVYSFGLIMYEMMTTEVPFEYINSFNDMYTEIIVNSKRPEFNFEIPDCYRKLIEWCWSANPDDRPTFDEIANILKSDPSFITDQMDSMQFLEYARYIENADIEFNSEKKIFNQDDLIKKKSKIQETSSISNESDDDDDEKINDNQKLITDHNESEKVKHKNAKKTKINKRKTKNINKINESEEDLTNANKSEEEKEPNDNENQNKKSEELSETFENSEIESNDIKIKESENLAKTTESKEKDESNSKEKDESNSKEKSSVNSREDLNDKSIQIEDSEEKELNQIEYKNDDILTNSIDKTKTKQQSEDEGQIQLNCEIFTSVEKTISNDSLTVEKQQKETSLENSSTIAELAKKYSQENDTENTYKYMNLCISNGQSIVVLEYAINLYKKEHFKVALNYFNLLSEINHPIALYFIAIMKYFGQGCDKDQPKSFRIMKYLSSEGIECATEFIENHFDA